VGDTIGIDEAVAALLRGDVVVLPTDTVYGLAARAEDPAAVRRIFDLKSRPRDKAVQVLVPDADWLDRLARPSEHARRLAAAFWPGPLTIVLPASRDAPPAAVSDGTIGLRVPDHPVSLDILSRVGPLVASSANRSGETTPAAVEAIRRLFGDGVAAYVDAGTIAGHASTVVDLSSGVPVIVREGAVSEGAIAQVLEGPI
jgi:tRNA threonylcarbamoyl adenosine modification protein (Sua5/YciO/YrdC/YwlC family)